ncbi:MAG: transcription antitermination factor NusB [Desulfohalobiaceae bacterium]
MAAKNQSTRRQAREQALQVLYSCNFYLRPDQEQARQTFSSLFPEWGADQAAGQEFAWELVQGVLEHQDRLDKIIAEHSKNWRLERIAKIELSAMRLALFEMLYRQDVPLKVAINEGIELCKKFGDGKSGRFVNGILDAIAKQIRQGSLQELKDAS